MLRKTFVILTMVLALMSGASGADAGDEASIQTAAVRIDGAVLFPVRGVAAYPARERAAAIADRIIALADDPVVKADSVVAVESDHITDIMAGDRISRKEHYEQRHEDQREQADKV